MHADKPLIYFDNAATTPLDPEVLQKMIPYLSDHYGNPSSIHSIGRKAKAAVETSRKKIAELLDTSPAEIFFTSGGTEADNSILKSLVYQGPVNHVITTKIEHHAVLHPVERLEKEGLLSVHYLPLDAKGNFTISDLEKALHNKKGVLVSLMHGNNEIGNLIDLEEIGRVCRENNAYFHSDTVQTVGKLPISLKSLPLDFIAGAAHKFYGPKGVGFMYIRAENKIAPLLDGGAQERNMRGGTENVASIVGMAFALEKAIAEMEVRRKYIKDLKAYFIKNLRKELPGITFNGMSGEVENSLYHLVNVRFPVHKDNDMLLFHMDIEGICVSGGSACSSGTDIGSHVLKELPETLGSANVRFSFNNQNTKEEIDCVIAFLKKVLD